MLELPQPPTDNIYKFFAIFGLVLFLASGLLLWGQVQQRVVIESEIEHLTQEIAYNLKLPDSPRLDTGKVVRDASPEDKAKVARVNELKERIADLTLPFWLLIAFGALGTVGGLILMVKGFRLWYDRAQVYQDRVLKAQADNDAKKLEEAKSQLSRTIAVHKVQAELEVTAYREIWEPLAVIESTWDNAVRLWPATDEALASLKKPLIEARLSLVEVVRKHRPFYPPGIYTELELLLRQVEAELSRLMYLNPRTEPAQRDRYHQDFELLRNSITRCAELIRARLASMTV